MPQEDPQGRKWQLTINNPIDKGFTHNRIREILESKKLHYFCMGDEQGETQHTHVFFASSSPMRFSTIKKQFPTAHIEKAMGTAEENKAYIAKSGKWEQDEKHGTKIEGTFEEWGIIPVERQGERSDLALLYAMVKDGMTNFEIMEYNPDNLMILDKIERVRQTVREQEYRENFRNMDVTYIWGATGTGKTRSVMEKNGYSGVYRVTDYKHPFDGYSGEDVLLLDEFSTSIRIQEMLNVLDGYPLSLPCRYTNKVACFTQVYIISNICLSKQYQEIQCEAPGVFKALLRRINRVVHYTGVDEFNEYETADYMHNPFL